jgi:hypothetical protein
MKILEPFKTLKPVEIGALSFFILFIILPFKLPIMVANMFDSSIGFILLFVIAIYLFFYTNPILGIIFILVAYELIRRSSEITTNSHSSRDIIVRDNTTQESKDSELEKLNPVQPETLEEEMVNKMVPARNEFIKGDLSDFKPNMNSNVNASLYN